MAHLQSSVKQYTAYLSSNHRQNSKYSYIRLMNAQSFDITSEEKEVKVYGRRWLMLALFSLCNMCNLFHWIQYSVINNIICKYYDVKPFSVDILSMIYMLMYIILVIPAAYFLNQKGLRWTVTVGILGTALGGWIKVLSVSPDRFYVTVLGQVVAAMAQSFLFGIATRVAACWFGPDQVSTASAIGFIFGEMGVGLGFFLPPLLVDTHPNMEQVERELRLLFFIGSVVPTALLVLVLLFFRDAPPQPPSHANAKANNMAATDLATFTKSLKIILTNKSYVFLLLSFSLSNATVDALNTLLNQIILVHFKDLEEYAGRLGLGSILCGLIGSFLFGMWLDRTHRFKYTAIFLYSIQLLSFIFFGICLWLENIALLYVTMCLLGIGAYSYYTLTYEFAAELTYPEPEGISSGILNAVMYFMGIVMTVVFGVILRTYGDFYTNVFFLVVLLFGFVFSLLVNEDMKRYAAQNGYPFSNTKNSDIIEESRL